ncbi:MAG: hypothetical protein JSS99_16295 [Actinobacteria bacterium]|nr:hypothetical protein [Actinomycetota bacterium]
MRQLAGGRDSVPAPLRQGITEFGRELQHVEQRLRELDRGPGPRLATRDASVRLIAARLHARAVAANGEDAT